MRPRPPFAARRATMLTGGPPHLWGAYSHSVSKPSSSGGAVLNKISCALTQDKVRTCSSFSRGGVDLRRLTCSVEARRRSGDVYVPSESAASV